MATVLMTVLSASQAPTCSCISYLSLNHAAPAVSHAADKVEDVQVPLCLDSLQLCEEGNEGTRPAHPSTAVHHYGGREVLPGYHHPPHKLEESSGVLGHSMVGPDGEMVVGDYSLRL